MGSETKLSGPDLTQGVASSSLADGKMLVGHADGEAVLLARRGTEVFAIGATCTHYSGPLGEGVLGRRERSLPLASRLFQLEDRHRGTRARV